MSVRSAVRIWALCLAAGAAALVAGCGSDSGLDGVRVPNALPDTRVTGGPPDLRHAGFSVHFFWTGSDPDGEIRGFQWRLSDNGLDGISVRDTLTVDPATGDTLNPWHYTTAGDTTFQVAANIPDFPEDAHVAEQSRRSYQTHTLFVRAVDEQGGLDPTPAMVSFTATTLTPTVAVTEPVGLAGRRSWSDAPPTVALVYTGNDPDFELGVPTRVRYLWKEARYAPCAWITSDYEWGRYGQFVLSEDDSLWSDWQPYPLQRDQRRVSFPNQREHAVGCPQGTQKIGYIFAIQVADTAGAVTPYLTYGVNVINLKINSGQSPLLTINERYLGSQFNTGTDFVWGVIDIAQNQPLEFSWAASATGYAGLVTGYRYGWDVADVTNDEDPGWSVQRGLSAAHLRAPRIAFSSGFHTLTVEAYDNSDQVTRLRVELNVVPVPSRELQAPLLIVDDVVDKASNAWQAGSFAYDRDLVRDQFWLDVVDGNERVEGFDQNVHVADLEELSGTFSYADLVQYRALVWMEKKAVNSYVTTRLATSGASRYNWLGAYQRQVGNVLLCGQQVLHAFVGDAVRFTTPTGGVVNRNLMMPMIFDTAEFSYSCNNQDWAIGFGERQEPDGSMSLIGPTLYPYDVWGIACLDQTGTPSTLYACAGIGQTSRRGNCAGLKAVILDPAFKAQHIDLGAMPDTIYTWRTLDYVDYPQLPAFPDLSKSFVWNVDEFYDTNITSRPTAVVPRLQASGEPMIEPMFRYYARYDWIDDVYARRGVPQWPAGYFTVEDLWRHCGRYILGLNGRTKVAGAPVGLLSHASVATKPGGRADILWGFDPSRFDRAGITKAIRWVLGEQFGLRFVHVQE